MPWKFLSLKWRMANDFCWDLQSASYVTYSEGTENMSKIKSPYLWLCWMRKSRMKTTFLSTSSNTWLSSLILGLLRVLYGWEWSSLQASWGLQVKSLMPLADTPHLVECLITILITILVGEGYTQLISQHSGHWDKRLEVQDQSVLHSKTLSQK